MVEVDASLKYGMDYFGFIGVRKLICAEPVYQRFCISFS